MKTKRLARPFEIKSLTEEGTFSGYGSVFGVVDSYGDVVQPGAFAASLASWSDKGKTPALLWQHDSTKPCGKWSKLAEDGHGLLLEGKLALKTQQGAEAYELLKMGAISGLSIGYSIPKGGGEWDPKSETFNLKQIDLWETSLVTFPANEDAQVAAVKAMTHGDVASVAAQAGKLHGLCSACTDCGSQADMCSGLDGLISSLGGTTDEGKSASHELKRLIESFLRDAGKSRTEAKAGASAAFKALGLRDADDELAQIAESIRSITQTITKRA
jgi:HK97 family phage prohead protease